MTEFHKHQNQRVNICWMVSFPGTETKSNLGLFPWKCLILIYYSEYKGSVKNLRMWVQIFNYFHTVFSSNRPLIAKANLNFLKKRRCNCTHCIDVKCDTPATGFTLRSFSYPLFPFNVSPRNSFVGFSLGVCICSAFLYKTGMKEWNDPR